MEMIERLASFPAKLRAWTESTPRLCERSSDGNFALVEHAWHLADLERDYGARLERIVKEDEPSWADFDGERVAEERNYMALPLPDALREFEAARAANVLRMRAASEGDWSRSGHHDGKRRMTFGEVVAAMDGHDADHSGQIENLLRELGIGVGGGALPPSLDSEGSGD
ncbi:MAG TPA: DinB family protein [Thermoanaerobaculia bacterium]|nr:DinB family protein [Thermoanaerobaculia bacterium]